MNKFYTESVARIEKLLSDRAEQKEQIAGTIEEQRELLNQISKTIVDATIKGDSSKYKDAKKKRDEINDVLEMNQKRADMIRSSEIVTEEESEEFKESIFAVQEKEAEATLDKLTVLFKELDALYEKANAEINEGNELICLWHNKIRKYGMAFANGNFIDKIPGYDKLDGFFHLVCRIHEWEVYKACMERK